MKFLFWTLRTAVLFVSIPVFSQSSTENYVLSRTYRVRGGELTSGTKYWGNPDQVQTSINYLDGLGKPKQSIAVGGTPKKRDIANISLYNSMHELEKEYLPVAMPDGKGDFKSTANINTAAGAYYNAVAKVGDPTTNFWTETVYDNSPLNRPKNQKAPGVTTGVRKSYRTNQSSVHSYIKLYKVVGSGVLDATVDNYAESTLTIIESLDESDKKVEEFTDRNGRVVLKRVAGQEDTYYVYNEKGQLRYVLQPQFQESSEAQTVKLEKYAFQYTYDGRGRVAAKRVPGQGVSTMTYDNNTDMLQYLVDGKGQRFYYKYDNLNRQIEMGLGMIGSGEKALVKTKYDNYSGLDTYTFDAEMGLTDADDFVGIPKSDSKKGLTTMVSARVLDGSPSENTWLNTVFFYDKKGRLIQTQRQLYDLGNGTGESVEQVSYQLDFAGNILRESTKQVTADGIYRLVKIFKYDHQNRLLSIGHTFYKDTEQKLSYTHVTNTYNEVGSLLKKSLHNESQELTYKYTPRGWIYAMLNGEGKTYKVDLGYNANGNINKLNWQTQGYTGEFSSIVYDGSNRLTAAQGAPYSEFGITYDKNGNIITLKRNRDGVPIDDLIYHQVGTTDATNYNGNQLVRVMDNSNSAEGFNNGSSGTAADYAYDQNGNLTSDKNKGITGITYNALNLPQTVTMEGPNRSLQYIYDGAGNKLMSVFPTTSTHYAGAFEYDGEGDLVRIALEEGQLVQTADENFVVNYYLRDHLGNVRMVIDEEGKVLQETEYYAFGLPVARGGTDAENKYLYNGKEKQAETQWMDYGARMYMPEIGRWGSVDKESERYERHSSFAYVLNRPTVAIDPDGRRVYFVGGANNDQDGWNYIQRWNNAFAHAGIADFRRVNMSHGKLGDIIFTTAHRSSGYETVYNPQGNAGGALSFPSRTVYKRPVENETINKTVAHYKRELKDNPLTEGEQFNLAGYSYGSVLQAQAALKLANSGQVIDNLVLIGSPISDKSELWQSLTSNKNIKNVLRYDLKGDALSNPQDVYDYIIGAGQGLLQRDNAHHFDAARPARDADLLINVIVQWLKQQGVKN